MVSYPNQITGPVTITGTATVTGLMSVNGGTSSAGSAPVLTPTLTNGTPKQLSDTTRDYVLYLEVGTAGVAFTLSIGPTSGVAVPIVTSVTPVTGMLFTVRVPAGWYVGWAGTGTTLANQSAVGC